MKLLMLNYEFPPLGGGSANATYYLLKEFAHYPDLQIDLVTSSVDKDKEENFSENIRIFYLAIAKGRNWHYQSIRDLSFYTLRAYWFCKRLLKRNTYQFCHSFFGIPCAYIAQRLGLPYIVSLRGSDVPFFNPRFYWWDKFFFKRLSQKIWPWAQAVIANSNGLKELALRSLPSQKIEVIYNGVDTNQFRPRPTDSGTLRALCISRLIRRKGLEYLIKAFANLKEQDVKLSIVGSGNQKQRLKTMVSVLKLADKVEFTADVPHQEINRVYHHHDLFILPSLNEGMSNSALEAMACGLPVILTDTGGTQELCKGNGFVVRERDHRALEAAIERFLTNRRLLMPLGQRSRERAVQMSWAQAAQEYYKLYQTVLRVLNNSKISISKSQITNKFPALPAGRQIQMTEIPNSTKRHHSFGHCDFGIVDCL